MTIKPFIDFIFENGGAVNVDGSFHSTVNKCKHKAVSINLNRWGRLSDALSFGPGSHVKIPHKEPFGLLEAITVEAVVKIGMGGASRQNIFESQNPPLALYIIKVKDDKKVKKGVTS